jgi:hypothetical protein
MAVLPKPKSSEETVGLNLNRVQAQIAIGMDKIERIQSLTSDFIKDHFDRIPNEQVLSTRFLEYRRIALNGSVVPQLSDAIKEMFTVFDLNGDKRIDPRELRFAFSSMVCPKLQI